MRILMIVSNDVVHDTRVAKEARSLRAAGHEVTFVGWDRSGRLPRRVEWDGFRVLNVPTGGPVRLIRKDLFRIPIWWRRAVRVARSVAFDVIHCHDLDTLPIGVRLKRRTGLPLVYDCHEVFAYMIEEDAPRFVTNFAFSIERRLAPLADRVIAVNPAVGEYIDDVSGKSPVIVRNCTDPVTEEYRPPTEGPFTLLYLGTLHRSRFILEAIDGVAAMPDVRLVLGGSKALTETVRARCARQPNTKFIGLVPNDRVLPMTIDAHAVLSMFDPAMRINQVGLPNKIFEAMACGRPSLVTRGLMMADIVEREDCGLSVPYAIHGFQEAVARLRDDRGLAERLGRNGLAAAKREYNWAMESRKLLEVYDSLR